MSETKKIVIVRTCDTSKGKIVVEDRGGTKDSDVIELPTKEADDLISDGFGREPPAHLQTNEE